jgi:hypothetical protein
MLVMITIASLDCDTASSVCGVTRIVTEEQNDKNFTSLICDALSRACGRMVTEKKHAMTFAVEHFTSFSSLVAVYRHWATLIATTRSTGVLSDLGKDTYNRNCHERSICNLGMSQNANDIARLVCIDCC